MFANDNELKEIVKQWPNELAYVLGDIAQAGLRPLSQWTSILQCLAPFSDPYSPETLFKILHSPLPQQSMSNWMDCEKDIWNWLVIITSATVMTAIKSRNRLRYIVLHKSFSRHLHFKIFFLDYFLGNHLPYNFHSQFWQQYYVKQ